MHLQTGSAWYVLRRPKMYTLHGTVGEVVAFLEGYCSGLVCVGGNGPRIVGEWYGFTEWLRAELNPVGDVPVIAAFVERYGNDAGGIHHLLLYFEAYTATDNGPEY